MGMSYYHLGMTEQAEQYLKRGFHLDPEEKQIMKGLELIEMNKM